MQPQTTTLPPAPPASDQGKFLISACNGTALYVLAYYLVWGLHQFAKFETSQLYQLRGNWDPSRITYTLADGEWWPAAIISVNGIGPLVSLLVGIAAFRWYWGRQRARRGHFKLLLVWVFMHACNAVFGALLADTFTRTGFWYVPDWLFGMGNVLNVTLALLAGLIQLVVGYFAAVAFLQAHDSKTVMRFGNRQRMVVSTLIAPWVAGSLFIALTKLPSFSMYEALHLILMGLLVTPTALGCLNELFSSTVRRPQATRVAWGLVGLAVAVAMVWRWALNPPITFG